MGEGGRRREAAAATSIEGREQPFAVSKLRFQAIVRTTSPSMRRDATLVVDACSEHT